jgi:hypothetical protein
VQHVIITQLLASCRRACHASAKKLQQFWSSLTPLPSALRNFGAILIQLPVKKLRSTKSLHMHTSFNERIKKKDFYGYRGSPDVQQGALVVHVLVHRPT